MTLSEAQTLRWQLSFPPRHTYLSTTTPAWVIALWFAQMVATAADWERHDGYRVKALEIGPPNAPGFVLVDPAVSGIRFTNVLSEDWLTKDSSLLSGSGVALGDIDGDGLCDIYFCSLAGHNALYHNLGHWHFEEIAEQAGVACPNQVSRGAVFADVNGDGALDLLVTSRGGGVRCFINDGKGHFHETTAEAGLATNTGSLSLALADVDGNGTLDLYVANFGVGSVLREGGNISTRIVNGKQVVVGRNAKRVRIINGKFIEFGEPDVLYLNDGHGHFTPVPWEKGAFLDEKGNRAETPWDFGLSVQMRDLNGDGSPDIYVCNDFFTPDRIWMNNGHGQFRAIATIAIRKSSYAAMGVDFADIDRDGRMDAFIGEMLARDPATRLRQISPDTPGPPVIGGLESRPQTGRNTLLWNRGDGTYAEIAQFAGLAASDWSWTPIFLDVDLDGFEDLLISTGSAYDLQDADSADRSRMRDPRAEGQGALGFPRIETHNCAFRNRGDKTFAECGHAWGFDSTRVSNGMALADLDNDGALDVVINCLNAPPLVYRNVCGAPRLAVRLKGAPPNTQGIGALVSVRGGAVPNQSQEIISGGRFLSGDDPLRVFAAGSLTNRLRIEVVWRSGGRSVVENALPNHLYEIDESGAGSLVAAAATRVKPLFEDASALLGHSHHEEPFDDFERQPLLPKRLSQLGPGVAWCDLAHNGQDFLVIGSGRNGTPSVYQWDGGGRFMPVACPSTLTGDGTGMALCPWSRSGGLLVGISNYEISGTNVPALGRMTIEQREPLTINFGPAFTNYFPCSTGPVAVADLDGDGQLEVFLGGRVIPGRYPEAASSFILRQQGSSLVVDTNLSAALSRVGMVSGAVFSDLDGDGYPELILACEWGPIRIFRNDHDCLTEWNPPLRCPQTMVGIQNLSQLTGLWQSVTTADLDGDGQMDIIIGNWGLNSSYVAEADAPLVMYYGHFNGDEGVDEILETMYSRDGTKLLARRNWRTVGAGMPFIQERIHSHREFSQASIKEILGDRFERAKKVQVNSLASVVLLNRGNCFEVRPLPAEAQWAPVFGVCVGDVDGDGLEDVILAQNFFGLPAESSRLDAGRALLLKGDGRGGLKPVPGQDSGVQVYGEQRGCALGDYDRDGRVDMVISQNGAATRVFHNIGAKPGLRIRLDGPAGNPFGMGAQLRINRDGKLGPTRELHAGSGYWSQDSSIQVMAAEKGDRLWIRWPGGRTTTVDVPDGAHEIGIAADGTITVPK